MPKHINYPEWPFNTFHMIYLLVMNENMWLMNESRYINNSEPIIKTNYY